MKQQKNYAFINWALNQQSVAADYFQPETEAELIELIQQHRHIRLVGTGHSWSAVCLTPHALINLDCYNRVIHFNREQLQLTVQAGIKLWQLNEYLDQHGLALSNLGSIAKQSLAGAISTGTHGSGINFQILASQIEAFTLIKANGEKVSLHHERDKQLFNLAVVNLGCLGVVSEITLRVVPAFNLHDYTVAVPFQQALNQLDELLHNTHHFKMWWFPHTENMVLYRYQRTQEPRNDSRFRQWLMDEFISVGIYRTLLRLGHLNKSWRKHINRLLVLNFNKPLDRIEKSYRVFNVPEPPLHRETEWAFDLSVAKPLLTDYKKMIEQSEHCINFIQEIRFTKADEYALSPCYQRDSIWLGVYNADNRGWEKLLSDFEQLARKYNGRPHWGKEFNTGADYLQSCYPAMQAFNQLRKEWDAEEKFTNDFIRKIFS
ncbi:MAG: D-arabinono-1,4-lactone oxidase [Chitinophagales bacterium]